MYMSLSVFIASLFSLSLSLSIYIYIYGVRERESFQAFVGEPVEKKDDTYLNPLPICCELE